MPLPDLHPLSSPGARLPGPYWHSNGFPDHVEPAGVPSLPHFWSLWGRLWPHCQQLPQVQRQGHGLLPRRPAPQGDGRGGHKNRQATSWADRLWLRDRHAPAQRAEPGQSARPGERPREGAREAAGEGEAEGAGERERKRRAIVL